jgi:hypothetical protein
MYKNIDALSSCFKYTGVWQNDNSVAVSFGTVSWLEFGFSGSEITLNAKIVGEVVFYLDGEIALPVIEEEKIFLKTDSGNHILKIKIIPEARLFFSGVTIPENESIYKCENKKYIQFIGDSITYKYPGYSSVTGDILRVDYSIVAYCGMSLKDGWGWYKLPDGLDYRPGMESMYFKLERPHETVNFSDYNFDFLRVPDALVIALGTNDYLNSNEEKEKGHIEAFITSYLEFAKNLRKKYINAKIYILKPFNESFCRDEAVTGAFLEIRDKLGNVELIDSINWNVEICSDGTHPTDLGYAQIAERLSAILSEGI